MGIESLKLIQSPPSFQSPSQAVGGQTETDIGKTVTTGTFNFGGSSYSIPLLIIAGATLFYLLNKKKFQ